MGHILKELSMRECEKNVKDRESRMTPRFWVNCGATEVRKNKFREKMKVYFEYAF